jgi:four helix bundle protein
MIERYEDLKVYQKAYAESLELHRLTLRFPQYELHELGGQMRRASKSIAMNIAEGYGRRSTLQEFKRFLGMALGSCDEVHVQLNYCRDLNYIKQEEYDIHKEAYTEIGKMLNSMLQKWNYPNSNSST